MHGSDRCASHLGLGGRKTTMTDEVRDNLLAMLRAGNYIEVACRASGVPRRTFDEWMQRGKSGLPADEPYRAFRELVTKARASGEVRNVAAIAAAAPESWQAAAWLLERQYPDRWGRVSVRLRDDVPMPPEPAEAVDEFDPFAEVDELAERRRNTAG